MRFALTPEQASFAEALDDLLADAGTVAAARAWADGNHEPGLVVWKRLAELGVNGLLVAEDDGGIGGSHVDAVVAHEALGRHLVVGPTIESTAYLATALTGEDAGRIAEGLVATVAAPYALDADVAELFGGTAGELVESIDGTRRLFTVADAEPTDDHAFDVAALTCAAQLVGAAEHALAETVAYAKQRQQFGRAIGSFQAIKHQLADVRIALDFARPLLYGAALALDSEEPTAARGVSAAKAFASDAALLAARTALQVHGAIGYTRELDLGLWLLRIHALAGAWGTAAWHRARVLDHLVGA